jgi:hypothetical protein
LLPVDARARACVVCPSWNAALDDRRLWTRLDLSAGSGVEPALLKNAAGLLAAAALRAGGGLQFLDVSGCRAGEQHGALSFTALCGVVSRSAATLRELNVGDGFLGFHMGPPYRAAKQLAGLLRAAPRLRQLHATELFFQEVDLELLQNEQLFKPLRLRRLQVADCLVDVLPLVHRLADTAAPTELHINQVPLTIADEIDALVDVALACRLSTVVFQNCGLSATAAPALTRLLDGGTVKELLLLGDDIPEELWDEAGATLLCDALRRSKTLTTLELSYFELWRIPAAAAALLGAVTGHPTLRFLNIIGNDIHDVEQRTAAGALLGALVAADTLTLLDVSDSSLGDDALGPLFDALPAVTRLRTLRCVGSGYGDGNDLSDDFIRNRALPAVRANSSLRELALGEDSNKHAVREAEDLVNSRAD